MKDDEYSKCRETESTKFLERINFPVHKATYGFVLAGRRSKSGLWWTWKRMKKKDALRICRIIMFDAKLRRALEESGAST